MLRLVLLAAPLHTQLTHSPRLHVATRDQTGSSGLMEERFPRLLLLIPRLTDCIFKTAQAQGNFGFIRIQLASLVTTF